MSLSDHLIRLTALVLLVLQNLYWIITEIQADHAKPKSHTRSRSEAVQRVLLLAFVVFMCLQLLGVVHVATFAGSPSFGEAGLTLIIMSLVVTVAARRTLGDNWAHAVEYQIKPGHELVTSGIYSYVRHPIYTGLAIGIVGIQLVAHSYLALVLLPAIALGAYTQAQREEQLLIKEFGQSYRNYMAHTDMFIPGLW